MEERSSRMLIGGLGAAAGALLGAAAMAQLVRRERFDFRGKSVLLTGGSRGLGLVMARRLARDGARLSLCARDPEELDRAHNELEGLGAEVLTQVCDVTEREQVERWVGAARERFGEPDVLINNAGLIEVGPLESMRLEDYEQAMRLHFWAPLFTTMAVLPGMRDRGAGRIVNVASIGGKVALPHLLPYCASKFALVGLSEGLRAELLKEGVLVTTVIPGPMRTGSHLQASFRGNANGEFAWFSALDSVPGISMSAERAATQILDGCRRGEAEVVVTALARFAVLFHGAFPGPTADLLGFANCLLPSGDGNGRIPGKEARARPFLEALTALSERAAARNNELG